MVRARALALLPLLYSFASAFSTWQYSPDEPLRPLYPGFDTQFQPLDQLSILPLSRQQNISRFTTPQGQLFIPLIDGEASTIISCVFIPAEPFTIDNYTIQAVSGNDEVLDVRDVSILPVANSDNSYNITAELDFSRWTGTTSFSFQALNASTGLVEAESPSVDILVIGITFYTRDESTTTLYGGPNYPLIIPATNFTSDSDVILNAFIQFVDGSNSTVSLSRPLSTINLTTTASSSLLPFSSSCAPDSAIYDGTGITLQPDCSMAFSTNQIDSEYMPPRFAFDFLPYQNGSFLVNLEWNDILDGSDLEGELYSTFLNVSVVGELPPVVNSIEPNRTFSTVGGETVRFYISNVPLTEASAWDYQLFIDFISGTGNATYQSTSTTTFENGTVVLTFSLPPGEGDDVPWRLFATPSGADQLQIINLTSPPYFFSFSSQPSITTISPATGPEEGGTVVTLSGNFPTGTNTSVQVFIDGSPISPDLITSVSVDSITFTIPPKQSGAAFNATITVGVGDETSNGVSFYYGPRIRIDKMTPTSGEITGGTSITLIGKFVGFDPSSNSGVYFGEQQLNRTLIREFNSTHIVFDSPPRSTLQEQTDFAYNVTVSVDGVASNAQLFMYDPLHIESMSPSTGTQRGGTIVTLTGRFIGYDPTTSNIVIGGKVIDSALLVSYNSSVLRFLTPPQSDVGLAYTQPVYVTIDSRESNRLNFSYLDDDIIISIDGGRASIDPSTGYYNLGACSNVLFRATFSSKSQASEYTYLWTLTELGEEVNILSRTDLTTNSDVIFIPFADIPRQNVPYNLTITVLRGEDSFQNSVVFVRLSVQAISVDIVDPRKRSPSEPNVTLTIPSFIGVPSCSESDIIINSTAITYIWNFQGKGYVFSYLNKTAPEDEISPTLLGREFHIPQSLMTYGTFSLSFTAFYTENSTIRGSDSTTVYFEPAPLVAQINGGETSQLISEKQSFKLSASQSRDPDLLSGDLALGLRYGWACRYGFEEDSEPLLKCGDALMPPDKVNALEFTLSAQDIAVSQNETSTVYIQYTLQVSKTSKNHTGFDIPRTSIPATSTLILAQETSKKYEALAEIAIVNNQSSIISRRSVKYYEDVTITPISSSPDTTWTFKLLAPTSQANTLLENDANLLTYPGYFTARSEAGRTALGIKANVLSPNTEYRFLISTLRTEYAINEQVVTIKTVEKPAVSMGKVATPSGNTNDTFVLSASTSYDGDFKLFFLLTDDFGFETCVGGCQGTEFVRFRLATPGNYSVRCDVYDSLGYTLLVSATGTNITVISDSLPDSDLSIFSGAANDAFLAGDHSDYQQLGTDMVKFILTNRGSTTPYDSDTLALFAAGLNQVTANAVPNAIQSTAYVRTAAALASLTPDLGVTYNITTLYMLINITINSVERTPNTAALQQLDDLLDFYDLTPELVQASYSQGTSRRRLLQEAQDTQDEVREIWLDLYEVMKEQLALTVLKRCSCGCVAEVTTGVSSKAKDALNLRLASSRQTLTAAAQYENPFQGLLSEVTIKFAHFCNSEQGTYVAIDESASEEVRFSWCKDIFENSIRKLYFSVAKTPDYIFLSQLHDNVTLTNGLVGAMIMELENNTIKNAGKSIEDCYGVTIPIPRELSDTDEEDPEDQIPKGLRFSPLKQWGETNTSGIYVPRFDNIITSTENIANDAKFTSAKLTLSETGVLTVATKFAWSGAASSLEGFLLLALEVAGVTLITLLLVILATLSAWLIATRLFAAAGLAAPIETDFTFVERDVYGRSTAIDLDEAQEATGGNQEYL